MTLKKEWKNKTLDTDKMYWVLFKDCKSPEVRKLNQNCQFIDKYGFPISPVRIIDVLDVCDYDQFVELKEKLKQLEETAAKAAEIAQAASDDNEHLRRLLKESRNSVWFDRDSDYSLGNREWDRLTKLLDEIDEALK